MGSSVLSYGLTKNATKTAEQTIKKGIDKVIKGKSTLNNTGKYGKGTIKKGLKIMREGIKKLNTSRGRSSVIASSTTGFISSVKTFFKKVFR